MKKIVVDILMFTLLLVEFSRVYLPTQIHEIIGICLIALVIIHLILNRRYLKAIPKGKYNLKRSLILAINVSFMIVFFLTLIFGLLSSEDILTFLNIGNITAVYLHKALAYLSLILLGIHLGFNLNELLKKIEEKFPIFIIYPAIIILGIYCLIQVDFINHLTGNYGFSMVTGNIIINLLEYLSIVLMITILTRATGKMLNL